MAGNTNLGKAKTAKKDEFYTQLVDIENELKHYKEHFKDKVVLCNCDDPYESNFFKYFAMNFNQLGLKKLIATCYDGSPIADSQLSLFEVAEIDKEQAAVKKAYKIEITEVKDENGDGAIDLADVATLIKNNKNVLSLLDGNGDFRSEECIELLKQADIVVTNPPFSLFREYVAQLVDSQKKFLIIGNVNATTYKDCFQLIKENMLWMGASIHSGDREFRVPNDYPLNAAGFRVDEKGIKYIRVKGVRWFTNMDYKERHEDLILYKTYNPEEYPKYDNYDAINVDKTADIPCDYNGVMGVPITFLDKYNPEQFEILGTDITDCEELGIKEIGPEWIDAYKKGGGTGHITARMHSLVLWDKKGARTCYKRILIRRRHPVTQYTQQEETLPLAAEKDIEYNKQQNNNI